MMHEAQLWDAWFARAGREWLERFLVSSYLREQRWFGAKARPLTAFHLRDFCWIPHDSGVWLYGQGEAEFSSGPTEAYFIFLGMATTLPAGAQALMEVPGSPLGPAVLFDAADDPAAGRAVLDWLDGESSIQTEHGHLRCQRFELLVSDRASLPVARSKAEQSNTNLIFGEQYVLKLFRRYQPGLNPDYEISRFLREHTSFRKTPPLLGVMLYRHRDEEPMVAALLQGWVPNRGDAWSQAVRSVVSQLEGRGKDAVGFDITLLARRTAEFHLAMASAPLDPVFGLEPLSQTDLEQVGQRIRDNLTRGLTLLEQRGPQLTPRALALGQSLAAQREALLGCLHVPQLDPPPAKLRIHGDYHLGQVLCTPEGDFVLLDFEGEPGQPLSERRARQSPLRDVAGMLRSFGYAAEAALITVLARGPGNEEELASAAHHWEGQAVEQFLETYLGVVGKAPFVPEDAQLLRRILSLYIFDKALYELLYELNNRPKWAVIPLRGIHRLLDGAECGEGS